MTAPGISKRLKVFQSLFQDPIENPEDMGNLTIKQKYECIQLPPNTSLDYAKAIISAIGNYSQVKIIDGLYIVYFDNPKEARSRLARASNEIHEAHVDEEIAKPVVFPSQEEKPKTHYTIKNAKIYNGIKGRNSTAQEKVKFTLNLQAIQSGEDKRATLMIKNIPNKYSQAMLIELIDEQFKGKYDFFYLPIDFKNKCNVGYAFINLNGLDEVMAFYDKFNGEKWSKFHSEKICEITYARVQGKMKLVNHFKASSIMKQVDNKVKPIVIN